MHRSRLAPAFPLRGIRWGIFALVLVAGCAGDRAAVEIVIPEPPAGLAPPLATYLQQAASRARQDPGAANLAELGLAYEANHLWPEARRVFEQARPLASAEPRVGFHLALVLERLGERPAALAQFELVGREHPGFAPVFDRLGEARLSAGDFAGAAVAFEKLTRLAPGQANGALGLAQVRLAEERFEAAYELAEAALELASGDRRGHYTLGLAARGLGREQEARQALVRGAGGGRSYLQDAWSAKIWQRVRRPGVAVEHARQALAAGDFRLAAMLAGKAREWDSSSVDAANVLAIALLKLGDPAASCAALAPARELDPGRLDTLVNLAVCLAAQGRPADALTQADRAVGLFPQVALAHHTRGRVLLGHSSPESLAAALASLEQARRLGPGQPEILRDLGFAHLQLRSPAAARTIFSRLLELEPGAPWGHLGLAEAALLAGEPEGAASALAAARELAPDHPGVASLAARLRPAPLRGDR